jgi:hypothetical protein
MKRKKKPPQPKLILPVNDTGEDILTCPQCGKQDILEGFDEIGACGRNIFCTGCCCEFDINTGKIHDSAECLECKLARIKA